MSLIANAEVLAVGKSSCGNKQVKSELGLVTYWAAEAVTTATTAAAPSEVRK